MAAVRALVLRQPSLLARTTEGLQSKVDAYMELFGQDHLGQVIAFACWGSNWSARASCWVRATPSAVHVCKACHFFPVFNYTMSIVQSVWHPQKVAPPPYH